MKMYTIYALVDPRNGETRYIGLTNNVYSRFAQHLQCDGSNPGKDAWMMELKAQSVMARLDTIETVEALAEARQREAYWIQNHLTRLSPLLNQAQPAYPLVPNNKRDTEHYVYVEVAFPRNSPAVQRMMQEAHWLDKPLRQLLKETCLKAYMLRNAAADDGDL